MDNRVSQERIDAYMDGEAPRTEEMELALQDSGSSWILNPRRSAVTHSACLVYITGECFYANHLSQGEEVGEGPAESPSQMLS